MTASPDDGSRLGSTTCSQLFGMVDARARMVGVIGGLSNSTSPW
jgi:hypothetical protein